MSQFVTEQVINDIADELQSSFECGSLHSKSSIPEIGFRARDELADRGLPTRPSLCIVIAKIALMTWRESIHQVKSRSA